jgi:hypothetical protein
MTIPGKRVTAGVAEHVGVRFKTKPRLDDTSSLDHAGKP